MKNKILAKTFQILEKISCSPTPVALKTLVDELGINYATASRITADLMENKLIEKCGYHHFAVAPGLIRLGALAKNNCPVTKIFFDHLSKYEKNKEHKIMLCSLHNKHLSMVYSDDELSITLKNSTLLAMGAVLLANGEKLPLPNVVKDMIEIFPEISAHEVTEFKNNYAVARQQGYLISHHNEELWSIVFPLIYLDNLFGIGLCGNRANTKNLSELYLNFSIFVTDLISDLNNELITKFKV